MGGGDTLGEVFSGSGNQVRNWPKRTSRGPFGGRGAPPGGFGGLLRKLMKIYLRDGHLAKGCAGSSDSAPALAWLRVGAGSMPGACILEGQPLGDGPWVRLGVGPWCRPEGNCVGEGDLYFQVVHLPLCVSQVCVCVCVCVYLLVGLNFKNRSVGSKGVSEVFKEHHGVLECVCESLMGDHQVPGGSSCV